MNLTTYSIRLPLKWLWWEKQRKLLGIYPEKSQDLRSFCKGSSHTCRNILCKVYTFTFGTRWIRTIMQSISSVFCSSLGQPLKIPSKKNHPFPCIPIFNNFLKFLIIKNIIVTKTHTLTLNKNAIFKNFNHKKHYSNKYIYINNKKASL